MARTRCPYLCPMGNIWSVLMENTNVWIVLVNISRRSRTLDTELEWVRFARVH